MNYYILYGLSFIYLCAFMSIQVFLQIYIAVIVQGSKSCMSMYVHVTIYIVLS